MPELVNSGDPSSDDFHSGPGIGELVPDFTLPDQFGRPSGFRPPVAATAP
jgi:hypothetical protein